MDLILSPFVEIVAGLLLLALVGFLLAPRRSALGDPPDTASQPAPRPDAGPAAPVPQPRDASPSPSAQRATPAHHRAAAPRPDPPRRPPETRAPPPRVEEGPTLVDPAPAHARAARPDGSPPAATVSPVPGGPSVPALPPPAATADAPTRPVQPTEDARPADTVAVAMAGVEEAPAPMTRPDPPLANPEIAAVQPSGGTADADAGFEAALRDWLATLPAAASGAVTARQALMLIDRMARRAASGGEVTPMLRLRSALTWIEDARPAAFEAAGGREALLGVIATLSRPPTLIWPDRGARFDPVLHLADHGPRSGVIARTQRPGIDFRAVGGGVFQARVTIEAAPGSAPFANAPEV